MKDFTAALAAAKDAKDPEDYVNRVKRVVRDEILILDPDALIEDTNYFSHSAIPDFVITWRREKNQRSIFLRDNLANVVAARDAEFIPDHAPAVITLDTGRAEEKVAEKLTSQIIKRPDALVTSATTLDVIDDKKTADHSPVSNLVRENFIKGAKGWVDSTDARLLLNSNSPGPASRTEEVQEAIKRHFQPDAATRISRAAAILALAGSSGWATELNESEIFAGQLNDGELRSILPWLLRESRSTTSDFWKSFGAMFTFADLEKLHEELNGLDLTNLIEANKNRWGVKRAYVGLHIDNGAEEDEPQNAVKEDRWSFLGKTIGKALPLYGSRLHVSYSGTKLPGRSSATSTTWELLEPTLLMYKLVRVELKGLRRSVIVNAEDSDDIRSDISEIADSLEDTYYVQSVTVRTDSVDEGTVETQIDFGKSLAVSNGDTTVADLTRAVQDILIRDL